MFRGTISFYDYKCYNIRFSIEFRFEGGPPSPPEVFEGVGECEIIGVEERFGREYIVEECRIYDSELTDTLVTWVRFRQDRTGLYEAMIPIIEPPMYRSAARGRPPHRRACPA